MHRPVTANVASFLPALDGPLRRLFDAAPTGPALAAKSRPGLDFARPDCLDLARHLALRSATLATQEIADADPGSSPDADAAVLALETRLATFVALPEAVTFASGTEAIRRTMAALLRPGDEVIVDSAAHPAMFETILATGARLHRSPAASTEGAERRLGRLARQPGHGRLVLAVPAVSAFGSRLADLAELSGLARKFGAILVADVSHDLGAIGLQGRGVMEIQACLGRIDILLGSLAPVFGAPGGFAAFRDPDLKAVLQTGSGHPAGLAPGMAAAILAALDLIAGPEGQRRRRHLHGLSLRLRNHLMADGLRPMGQASPFVPILLPRQTALSRTALLESAGPRVALLQAPEVPLHAPRWRLQLSAAHSAGDIDDLALLIRDVTRAFDRIGQVTRIPA